MAFRARCCLPADVNECLQGALALFESPKKSQATDPRRAGKQLALKRVL